MNKYITCADALKTLKHLLYETAMNQSDLNIIEVYEDIAKNRLETWFELIPSADVPEKLTDSEQRIFLSAMGKEEKLCKSIEELWKQLNLSSEDDVDLVIVCNEIIRKVKKALWMSDTTNSTR